MTYAYTLMRLVGRYVKTNRQSCGEGKLVVTYDGLKAANALSRICKEILAVLYSTNVWLHYYRQMMTAKFQRPRKIILRRQLHDIRKPFLSEDTMCRDTKKGKSAEVRTSAFMPPSNHMWSALLTCLQFARALTVDNTVLFELLMLFVALATRTRSPALLRSAMELPAWKHAEFLEQPLEVKADALASHLHDLHEHNDHNEMALIALT